MAKKKEKEVRQNEILLAAMECFSQKGYLGTTIDEVCKCAGIAKGGLYWHFPSKKSLLEGVLNFLCSSQQENWASLDKWEINKDNLKLIGAGFISQMMQNPQKIRLYAVLDSESLRDPVIQTSMRQAQSVVQSQLTAFSLQVLRVFPNIALSPEELAFVFNTVITGIVRSSIITGINCDPENLWDHFIDTLVS